MMNLNGYKLRALTGCILLALSACATDLSEPTLLPPGTDAGTDHDPHAQSAIDYVSIDPLPDTTHYYSAPIYGVGPQNGTVVVTSSANGEQSFSIDSGGVLCFDLKLTPGGVNQFKLDAYNSKGEYVDSAPELSIRQEGEPPESTVGNDQSSPTINAAENASVFDKTVFILGEDNPSDLFNSSENIVHIRNNPFRRDYIAFSLQNTSTVKAIRIESPSDCPIYDAEIFYSEQNSTDNFTRLTVLSSVINPGWYSFGRIQNDDGFFAPLITAPDANGTTVRRFAIEFYSDGCGGDYQLGEHKISTIEVIADNPDAEPNNAPYSGPACHNGGRLE